MINNKLLGYIPTLKETTDYHKSINDHENSRPKTKEELLEDGFVDVEAPEFDDNYIQLSDLKNMAWGDGGYGVLGKSGVGKTIMDRILKHSTYGFGTKGLGNAFSAEEIEEFEELFRDT